MRVPLRNGRGRVIGSVEVGAITDTTIVCIIEWTSRGSHGFCKGTRRLRMGLPITRTRRGPEIQLKWKERVRLKRAGLILPAIT
jgi:hypothetical protein